MNHSANEYARLGGFIHVNSAENYFSIFKRGVIGTFHHISEQHVHRYLAAGTPFSCSIASTGSLPDSKPQDGPEPALMS